MARQRMLHPGFFTDADLGECTPLARILFEGLWVEADREGRLVDDPRELKVKLLPYDSCSVATLIDELERIDAVRRYEVDGVRLLWLPRFTKYQHPHQRETASVLSAPPAEPSKGKAQPVPSPEKAMPSRAESVSESESVTVTKSVAVSVQPPARPKPTAVTPPTSPPDSWLGDDFWRWAESKRQTAGCPPQGPPGKLSTWWSEVRMLAETKDLQEAFLRFGDDAYWQQQKPALPFGGFMTQWNDFLPIRRRNAS